MSRLLAVLHDPAIAAGKGGLGRAMRHVEGALAALRPGEAVDTLYEVAEFTTGWLSQNLGRFDAVMLFGHTSLGTRADGSDAQAFRDFVRAGGGAFATGDHGSLGSAISGELYGLRWMRRWYEDDPRRPNPKSFGHYEIDTRTLPIKEELPPGKPVVPRLDGNDSAHRLLVRGPASWIVELPDHEHEGECAEDLPDDPAELDGFPLDLVQSVAYSIARRQRDPKPFVTPILRCIEAGAHGGPLVVDSTIHHWLDENLAGFSGEALDGVADYHRNIVHFLLPGAVAAAAGHHIRALEQHASVREAKDNPVRLGALAEGWLRQDPLQWRLAYAAALADERNEPVLLGGLPTPAASPSGLVAGFAAKLLAQ